MTELWLPIVSLAKILASFLVIFVWLPRRIFPQRADSAPIDRFFENLCLMTFFSVVAAHTLAVLRIHSTASLLACYVLLYLGVRWQRERGSFLPALKQSLLAFNVFVLRAVDGLVDLRGLVGEQIGDRWRRLTRPLSSRPARVHAVLFSAVLAVAAWLRLTDVFQNPALSFSDSYYHLEALKRLEAGHPYWQDIYPKGFHALMSVLHLTTWVDPVLVVKLIGPLAGVLIVLTAYYAAFRLTGSGNAALIAMLIAGIVDGHSSLLFEHLGSDAWRQFFGSTLAAPFMLNVRQTAGLSQELATVFMLPAVVFTHAYWTGRGAKRDLALSFMTATVVLMMHWIVAVVVAAGLALVCALSLLRPGLSAKIVARGTAALAAAAIVGNLQLVGLVVETGLAFTGSVRGEYAQALPGRYTSWLDEWGDLLPFSPVLYAAGAVAVAVGLAGLIAVRGAAGKILWVWTALFILALLLAIRAPNFRMRYLIPPDRVGEFMGIVLAVAVGALWGVLSRVSGERGHGRPVLLSQGLTVVLLGAILVVAVPPSFASAPRYEYSSLAELYYRISRGYPPLQWTIVSNVEDYSKALTKGWHVNTGEFLALYDPYDAHLKLPTPYVFIFVEKKPLTVRTTYQSPLVRRDEQRRLGEWVFVRGARFDDLALFFEDDAVLVYRWQER
jgi:hypothetical protein